MQVDGVKEQGGILLNGRVEGGSAGRQKFYMWAWWGGMTGIWVPERWGMGGVAVLLQASCGFLLTHRVLLHGCGGILQYPLCVQRVNPFGCVGSLHESVHDFGGVASPAAAIPPTGDQCTALTIGALQIEAWVPPGRDLAKSFFLVCVLQNRNNSPAAQAWMGGKSRVENQRDREGCG